ncbi:MAG: S8 family serine peptidase [Pseudomonadota bacterium]|nr:S8 family serine peptidase [Pseudomonadota bacterium]
MVQVMSKMNLNTTANAATLLLAGLFAMNVQAGTLDPELEAAIEGMSPGDPVDVIVRCTDPLDTTSVAPEDLLPALLNKASACETSLGNVLENTALEPPVILWIINGIAATVPVASLEGLANRAGVASVYLNATVELPPAPVLAGAPGNPPLTYWNISEIRATDLWEFGYYGTGVVVATMDTGVDSAHADIGPNWRGGSNSWYDPNEEHATPFDANGHGTGVMGLIVGGNAGGFDMGVAPDAQWISVKIFNDEDQSDLGKIHQGFQWLLDPNGNESSDDAPDIVNSSWVLQGTEGECLGEFAADIATLRAAGIAVVFSAGNTGPDAGTSMEPANDPASLSVGAIDSSQRVPSFSNRGPSACDGGFYPKLAAPGKDVLTAGLTTGGANPTNYAFGTGTSFAAPHVAGAIAVLKSAFPGKTMAEIESAIGDGALDLGELGPDNDSGAGLVDVVEAHMLLGGSTPSDADQDGVPDGSDLCPATPAGEAVDANGCSMSQLDSDGDGVSDALDQCPGTPAGTEVDADGCAVGPTDADQDGVPDGSDLCPATPAGETVDADGCSTSQLDSDGDGVSDSLDLCPGTPAGTEVDANGCAVGGPGDVTIVVTQASYNASRDKVTVWATSDLGKQADLSVTFTLADGSVTNSISMAWKNKNSRWESSIRRFVRTYGAAPVSVTVSGTEGSVSAPVQ